MKKKIFIRLSSSRGDNNLDTLGQFLVNFQSLVFSAGEICAGKQTRKGGNYPKYIRDTCTLEIDSVRQGSFVFELSPSGAEQETLTKGNLAEKSISLTYNTIGALNDKNPDKEINKFLPDPISRKRILQRIQDVLPVNENSYIELGLNSKKQQLRFKHKKIIEKLIPKISIPDSKKVTGRLTEIRVDGKKVFQIDSKEGLVSGEYDSSLEDFFKRSIGHIVEVEAKVDPKSTRTKLLVTTSSNCNKLDSYPIQELIISKRQHLLKKPLEVELQFDDANTYILFEPDFNVLATGKKLESALSEFNEQFEVLYNEYALADDASLTKQARGLKNRLLDLIGE